MSYKRFLTVLNQASWLPLSKFPSSTPHHCFFDTGSDLLKGLFNSESWARIIYISRKSNHINVIELFALKRFNLAPLAKPSRTSDEDCESSKSSWNFHDISPFVVPLVFQHLPTASKVSVARTPPPSPLSSPTRLISQPIICNPKPQSRSIAHDVMLMKMMQEKKYQEMQKKWIRFSDFLSKSKWSRTALLKRSVPNASKAKLIKILLLSWSAFKARMCSGDDRDRDSPSRRLLTTTTTTNNNNNNNNNNNRNWNWNWNSNRNWNWNWNNNDYTYTEISSSSNLRSCAQVHRQLCEAEHSLIQII